MGEIDGRWHWVSCLEKSPDKRAEEDLDIILSKLKTMPVFEHFPESVLQDFSRYAVCESFMGSVTLFKPGDPGIFWYAVISGSLEMLDVDPNDSVLTTSICQLQGGDSFGENVIFGKNRQTMVVTRCYSELLCVEAEHMKEIYEAHRPTMEKLLRLEPEAQHGGDTPTTPEARGSKANGVNEVDEGAGQEEEQASVSELAIAGMTLHQLIHDHFTDLFSDHRVNLFTYRSCCSGRKLVDWVMGQSGVPRARLHVVQMWQALLTEGIIKHVHNEHIFKDDPQLFYEFCRIRRPRSASFSSSKLIRNSWGPSPPQQNGEEDSLHFPGGRPRSSSSIASSPRSSRSSLTSILDECFDTISQLGPEVLIYATLMKDPLERTEEDIDMIYEELMNVRACRHLSNAVKRQLAACVRMKQFRKAGKYVFRQGDNGDSWYVILKGSVNIIIKGKGVVCSLHEGDEFGRLALVNEGVRAASVQTREENSYFLRIERADFRRILMKVESMTMRLSEHGRDVLLLERSSLGRYAIIKGTPDKMLDHLLDKEVIDEKDTFAEDFFLTYPAFMSISELCQGLIKRYHSQPDKGRAGKGGASSSASCPELEELKRKRIAEAVALWIRTARAELVKDSTFLKALTQLQDMLMKDGLLEALQVLNTSLSESIRFSSSPSPAGNMLIPLKHRKNSPAGQEPEIRMGISTFPPCQPQDKVPLRVHTLEHTCCRLQVRMDTLAKNIVVEACRKLGLKPVDFVLCEVNSSGEKVVFKEEDISVHTEMSVNGRLFLVPRKHTERAVPPLPDQNVKPVTPFPERESSREIASHLTVYDWNLFANIQQMELIFSIFGRHKFGKITTNLDLLVRRFNEVQYWVVTELCNEADIGKRVNLLKKFIKIAGYCKGFNNLNSFFAIVVALLNVAVTRLRQTWKELPPKFRRRFESFESLTDPSRNHKVLRAYQSKLPPPIIPFMPLVMKDSFFLHEGNETFIDGMVNFEKMRLVAVKVRTLNEYRSGTFSSDLRLLANKNPQLQQYIRNLKVMDNQQVLIQMSQKVEPPTQLSALS